ncbi:MAG: YidC/Oxa1 family membrane protein insertase [Ruminococcaceae bacterium]|nr:YidC/Oxa1 family membrane protein insertase [Oscillospiraceae bacterium]
MNFINKLFGGIISFLSNILGNQYILALLAFAILVELLLLPFGIKQQKNSIKQAKLRPKEMAIRKKYAGRDDQPTKQKMTMEIQELYQKEGYNPMGGCLPLLIQLPIILILYNVVMSPLQYVCGLSAETIAQLVPAVNSFGYSFDAATAASRNVDMMGAIRNILTTDPTAFSGIAGFDIGLADLPNLTLFGGAIDLGAIPSFKTFNWLLLVPLLTFLVYFGSMKLTRKLSYQPMADDKAMGCSNNVMDITMPLFSVFITFGVPAAIGVYWIFKSILGVIKQWILKAAMPIPVFTEEDYKAAEKEMNVRPEKGPRTKSGRVVRSLHHIDDEDFEDTREAAIKHREALEAQEAAEAEQKKAAAKGGGLLGGATLKKDDKPEVKEKKAKKKNGSTMDEYHQSLQDKMDGKEETAEDKNKKDGEGS